MKVLIVDDVASVRSRVAALLREIASATEVCEARDADEAFAAVVREAPDLVVIDLHLPGQSGIDVLVELAGRPHRPLLVVLTNEASTQHRQQCLALGADYFFDKSADVEVFAATLATIMNAQHGSA